MIQVSARFCCSVLAEPRWSAWIAAAYAGSQEGAWGSSLGRYRLWGRGPGPPGGRLDRGGVRRLAGGRLGLIVGTVSAWGLGHGLTERSRRLGPCLSWR